MTGKTASTTEGLHVTVDEEPGLIRIGLEGAASITEARDIRAARDRVYESNLPILVVDDGLTSVDSVAYGALVQWANAVRNRNIGWVMATELPTAARMFQMAQLNPEEVLYSNEESARKALDRGRAGQRVTPASAHLLALDGLRRK